jgi:hypothetical protein
MMVEHVFDYIELGLFGFLVVEELELEASVIELDELVV